MIINPNLFFFLILIIIICIFISIHFYRVHKKDEQHLIKVEEYIKRKYIPATVMLHNAILEAYEGAREKDNKFEIEAYHRLLVEIQGKW